MLKSISIVKSWRQSLLERDWEGRRAFVVIDSALAHSFSACAHEVVHQLPGGEGVKSLQHAEELFSSLQRHEFGAGDYLIGIGGGALLDVAGFVSATFHRGIGCILVPTTLLAQVDASIGGKNGLNLGPAKNVIGTIREPESILIDPTWLQTLPDRVFIDGLAEVVKYGVIADLSFFEFLEANAPQILQRDILLLETVLRRCAEIKSQYVERDRFDKGERAALNFGHTAAHAIELLFRISHGAAVSIGMLAESHFARSILPGPSDEPILRLAALLHRLRLPTSLQEPISEDALRQTLRMDKKRYKDGMRAPILHSLGRVVVETRSLDSIVTGVATSLRKMCKASGDTSSY